VCVLVKHLFRPPRLTHSSRVEREASRSISGVVHPWDPTRKSKRKEEKTLTFTKAAGAYRENLGSERRSQSPIYSMYVYVCMYAGESVVSFFFLVRLSAAIEAGARVYRCRRNQSITELPL
jgi:hypothetical protein